MKYTETVGIDVSKSTIDAYLHNADCHKRFPNNQFGFETMLSWCSKKSSLPSCLFCFEYTGDYSVPLARFLSELGLRFSIVPGLEIKRSTGLVRGKQDRVDAKRISEYAWLRQKTLEPTCVLTTTLFTIQKYLSIREHYVEERKSFNHQLKEFKSMFKRSEYPDIFKILESSVNRSEKMISRTEELISKIISEDQELEHIYSLLLSITGIGPVIAWNMLVLTHGFKKFSNSRKFACFAGVAPFPFQSGVSLNYKDRVSHLANKKIKALLNLGARSAITSDPELKAYYIRKQQEGKNKMSVINAVRNKLIHRMFSVVKRGTPYVRLNVIALSQS